MLAVNSEISNLEGNCGRGKVLTVSGAIWWRISLAAADVVGVAGNLRASPAREATLDRCFLGFYKKSQLCQRGLDQLSKTHKWITSPPASTKRTIRNSGI